jgi:hypothetical protein
VYTIWLTGLGDVERYGGPSKYASLYKIFLFPSRPVTLPIMADPKIPAASQNGKGVNLSSL